MTEIDSKLNDLKACKECGCIQHLPAVQPDCFICCCRCGHRFRTDDDFKLMRWKVSAFALAALVLFPAAIFLPILQIEQFGHLHKSSLIGGIKELYAANEWVIATVVLVFSFVFPILKLLALLELCWLNLFPSRIRQRLYRAVESVGKWSMMDVLLLALMVMWVKLSDIVSFQFGPATLAFAACVILSMLASFSFDPEALWHSVE